ncbi:MAG: tetratricopeptide repeat protein [Chloroflexota bacterium]|nr:tetratricopeptide repeat protein [Chloroflexota bacterium]
MSDSTPEGNRPDIHVESINTDGGAAAVGGNVDDKRVTHTQHGGATFNGTTTANAPIVGGNVNNLNIIQSSAWVVIGLLVVAVVAFFTLLQFLQPPPPPPPATPTPIPTRTPLPAGKTLILIADFEAVGSQGQQPAEVTEIVVNNLRQAVKEYNDVVVERLGHAITSRKSEDARQEAQAQGATIMIWGWYTTSPTNVALSAHFELVRPIDYPPKLPASADGATQIAQLSELQSFALQTNLSKQMSYLSLFTVGLVRYSAEDWASALTRFSAALSQGAEDPTQDAIYFYRGTTFYKKKDYDRAIADYNKAIELHLNASVSYNNRGSAYATKGDYSHAIADYNKAIELQPNASVAY